MRDFLLNPDDMDLQFESGDIVMGESTLQHQQLLLVCNKGDFKENPAACVGIGLYLKEQDNNFLLADIKAEFEKDGMIVRSIIADTDKINIDASYKATPNTA